jgi:glycosyltransferase involved in cell wall biosynthesis
MTYKLKGVVSLASNTPGTPTGYGVQGMMVVERMKRHGIDVAALSNYGLEGSPATLKTKHGEIPHYPRGLTLYSGDVLEPYHKHHLAGRDLPNFILTLYDAWVYLGLELETPIVSWTPVDHMTLPPKVLACAMKDNVHTLAMSPFGQKAFERAGIESTYIPHAVDTKIYKPTREIEGMDIRDYYGVGDNFLVGIVGANKANGSIHRKAYGELFMAFGIFLKSHPEAKLYVHAEVTGAYGGFNLLDLSRACGIPKDSILFPDPEKLRFGYSEEEMAALYTGMDVLLHASYGEGFGVPAIEAQACGTKVIGSSWAATPDLLSDECLMVEGQPFWDEAQKSFFQIPLIPSIINALEDVYCNRGDSLASVEFAKQFDADVVWDKYWLPFLKTRLA